MGVNGWTEFCIAAILSQVWLSPPRVHKWVAKFLWSLQQETSLWESKSVAWLVCLSMLDLWFLRLFKNFSFQGLVGLQVQRATLAKRSDFTRLIYPPQGKKWTYFHAHISLLVLRCHKRHIDESTSAGWSVCSNASIKMTNFLPSHATWDLNADGALMLGQYTSGSSILCGESNSPWCRHHQ